MDGQGIVGLVWNDLDLEIWLSLKLLWLGDGAVSDFVESIRRVGNQLSQEDLLVGVEGVDDQAHQLLDVSIECERIRHYLLRNLGEHLQALLDEVGPSEGHLLLMDLSLIHI